VLENITVVKRDSEIVAYDRRFRKDEEVGDIETFLDAYERATGDKFEIEKVDESPDAICRRPDGTLIGVEHTRIRRSPEAAHWQAVLDHQYEMSFDETLDEIDRLIWRKSRLRDKFRTSHNILLIALYESDFDSVVRMLECFPLPDVASAGLTKFGLPISRVYAMAHIGRLESSAFFPNISVALQNGALTTKSRMAKSLFRWRKPSSISSACH
jgi:hypothetical protein